MPVTKQTYTANATWTAGDLANLFRSALIDAGLMTDWFDSFTRGGLTFRVLKVEYDNTKTYGTSFYCFVFAADSYAGVSIASGWDAANDVPVGTQYIDYHILPSAVSSINGWGTSLVSGFSLISSTNVNLHRYTSAVDSKQSWFVLQQGTNRSKPFTILSPATLLHPWLDLGKGMLSGYLTAGSTTLNATGTISFNIQENVRRCLAFGQMLRGDTNSNGSTRYHDINCSTYSYVGLGSKNNSTAENSGPLTSSFGGGIPLPVAKTSANPAFATDYVPVCTGLPWSPFTSTPLASDFGVYMHYADNAIAFQDKFIVAPGMEEWEVLSFANNATVVDGASATFLARVV